MRGIPLARSSGCARAPLGVRERGRKRACYGCFVIQGEPVTHEQSNDVLRCTDQELIAKLQQLARADRALSVQLLLHLAEMDARGLYREQAYTSMFEYAVQALHMSEAQAYLRIQVARLGR